MAERHTKHDIPPGTLEMLVLRTLQRHERLHGFEIAEAIGHLSSQVLSVEEGSLYPALQRMLVKGWVLADWGRTEENRRARYYTLTAVGRRELEREIAAYRHVADAIARVIQPT